TSCTANRCRARAGPRSWRTSRCSSSRRNPLTAPVPSSSPTAATPACDHRPNHRPTRRGHGARSPTTSVTVRKREQMRPNTSEHVRDILVIGAGLAGLYAVHAARQRGRDVLCLEAGSGVGGTWYWNRYPGARCDVESIDYSYSFDEQLQRDWCWSERYASQPEILSYIHHVTERFTLAPHIRLDTTVTSAVFDESGSVWRLGTAAGQW